VALRLIVAPALIFTLGCCTLVDCNDGLTIDLDPMTGWPAGSYRFTIDVDSTRVTCQGALPLPACTAGRGLTCDRPDVLTIGESGCALGAGAQGFPSIDFDDALRPKRVVVTVARNESVLTRSELTPEFQTSQPNGAGCPPTCTQARGRVSVRF
jgi:hypothetical protein